MNAIRVILGISAISLGVYAYNQPQVPSEENVAAVVETVEKFPEAPSQELQTILSQLDQIVTDKNDALVFARAFRDWSHLLARENQIATLQDFVQIQDKALQDLLLGTAIQGKYQGKISDVMKDVYDSTLAFLKNPSGEITSLQVDQQVRQALTRYFDSLSWKMASIAGVK